MKTWAVLRLMFFEFNKQLLQKLNLLHSRFNPLSESPAPLFLSIRSPELKSLFKLQFGNSFPHWSIFHQLPKPITINNETVKPIPPHLKLFYLRLVSRTPDLQFFAGEDSFIFPTNLRFILEQCNIGIPQNPSEFMKVLTTFFGPNFFMSLSDLKVMWKLAFDVSIEQNSLGELLDFNYMEVLNTQALIISDGTDTVNFWIAYPRASGKAWYRNVILIPEIQQLFEFFEFYPVYDGDQLNDTEYRNRILHKMINNVTKRKEDRLTEFNLRQPLEEIFELYWGVKMHWRQCSVGVNFRNSNDFHFWLEQHVVVGSGSTNKPLKLFHVYRENAPPHIKRSLNGISAFLTTKEHEKFKFIKAVETDQHLSPDEIACVRWSNLLPPETLGVDVSVVLASLIDEVYGSDKIPLTEHLTLERLIYQCKPPYFYLHYINNRIDSVSTLSDKTIKALKKAATKSAPDPLVTNSPIPAIVYQPTNEVTRSLEDIVATQICALFDSPNSTFTFLNYSILHQLYKMTYGYTLPLEILQPDLDKEEFLEKIVFYHQDTTDNTSQHLTLTKIYNAPVPITPSKMLFRTSSVWYISRIDKLLKFSNHVTSERFHLVVPASSTIPVYHFTQLVLQVLGEDAWKNMTDAATNYVTDIKRSLILHHENICCSCSGHSAVDNMITPQYNPVGFQDLFVESRQPMVLTENPFATRALKMVNRFSITDEEYGIDMEKFRQNREYGVALFRRKYEDPKQFYYGLIDKLVEKSVLK
ncbi:hypothetical protein HK098_007401 [Nowakowskiella sp. JEL0407]|nr:hypothetical protein HK098_007401 [Nowakowskiella sp. JEL0407]